MITSSSPCCLSSLLSDFSKSLGLGVVLISFFFLSACGPRVIPKELRNKVDRGLSFDAVYADPTLHRGKMMLVGGEIIAIHNKKDVTEIEVLQKPLGGDHHPLSVDQSAGRFVYTYPGFLDPSIYKGGRRITVIGQVTGVQSKTVGEAEVVYLVLTGEHLTLWPASQLYRESWTGVGFGFDATYSR